MDMDKAINGTDIDELISKLQKAKEKGYNKVLLITSKYGWMQGEIEFLYNENYPNTLGIKGY